MFTKELQNNFKEHANKVVFSFKEELSRLRTGRASLSILDTIRVDYYGNMVGLKEVATLSIPQPQLIMIQPWENKIVPAIEKAINKANIGLTPINDGKAIKLPLPSLTQERREELAKLVKKEAENSKVALRNIRRDLNDKIKNMFKEKEIAEDDQYRYFDDVKKLLDEYTNQIEQILEHKVKEILD